MSSYKITIPYTPKPKASVRLARGRAYNPSQKGMHLTENYVRKHLPQMNGSLMSGPLLVIIHFRIPARSCYRGEKRKQLDLKPHIARPDGDNLEKFLNDAMTGLLWDDDSCITWLVRSKSVTSDKLGSTTIFVKEIPYTDPNYEELLTDIQQHIRIKNEAA